MKITLAQLNELFSKLPEVIETAVNEKRMEAHVESFSDFPAVLWLTKTHDRVNGERTYVKLYVENYALFSGEVNNILIKLQPDQVRYFIKEVTALMMEKHVGESALDLVPIIRKAPPDTIVSLTSDLRLTSVINAVALDHNVDVVIKLNKTHYPDWAQLVAIGAARVLVEIDEKLGKFTVPAGSTQMSRAYTGKC